MIIDNKPEGVSFPPALDLDLIDCLEMVLNKSAEWVETEDGVGFQFILPLDPDLPELQPETVLELNPKFLAYEAWKKEKAAAQQQSKKVAMSRNAFCEEVLKATLTNPRWGWVGVKEGKGGERGALYLFAWEHNRCRDGEGTVGLFHSEVSTDANGRRRPGHRDALEKIDRVQAGELIPYVVWQAAEDPNASKKIIESMNAEFITACELYIDGKGFWNALLGKDVHV